jgi:hypothetical protein
VRRFQRTILSLVVVLLAVAAPVLTAAPIRVTTWNPRVVSKWVAKGIAGFVIQNGSVRAVIRAVGPSLTAFGINNALPDTTLQIKDQNGAIVIENDDWQSDQKQELQSTGLQPSNNLEAAVVLTLQPGQYNALVRGKPETTGTGVVQVYFLQ